MKTQDQYNSLKIKYDAITQEAAHYKKLFQKSTKELANTLTEHITTNAELRINKENYEHITQNVPSGISIVNRDGNHLFVNKKACEITGYSISELLKVNIKDLIYPDFYNKIIGRLKSRLNGLEPENNYETRIITKSGKTKIVELSGSKTKWMGEIVDLVVINDITEKRRFSDLLKVQGNIDYLSSISIGLDKSFRKIFDTLFEFEWVDSGGIYLMNKNNDGLELVFHKGVSAKLIKESQFIPLESERFKMVREKKALHVNSIKSPPLSRILIEDGYTAILVLPLIHEDKIIGALNLASKFKTDLSENERMIFDSIGTRIAQMIALITTQDELQLKNQELQQTLMKIQEKQQLLIQKSKLESLGEMAAGVAHEINQPIGIMQLALENVLIKISSGKADEPYLENKFESIFRNIERIQKIINQIRIFSRDQKSIIIERVNVNEAIQKACSFIKEQYRNQNIILNLELSEDIGYTLGNTNKLEQVIFNLLSNAKDALNEKEASVEDIDYEKHILIKSCSENNSILIEVSDNGIGIKKEDMDRIFNPFFTTKPEGVGTGLGLSIVYGIITEMKGEIAIESKRNEFATASITLPEIPLKD